jgi:hypothetical protein
MFAQVKAALQDGWTTSSAPDKNSAHLKKPTYCSAIDCIKPEVLQAAAEVYH